MCPKLIININAYSVTETFVMCLTIANSAFFSDEDEYMALGISGSGTSSQMLGADVAVAYMDGLLGTTADYNISGKFPVGFSVGIYLNVGMFNLIGDCEFNFCYFSVQTFWVRTLASVPMKKLVV